MQSTANTKNGNEDIAYGDNESDHQVEYSSKLIIGSVIGVAMAIVLIIMLVKSALAKCTEDPRCRKGIPHSHESNIVHHCSSNMMWIRLNVPQYILKKLSYPFL